MKLKIRKKKADRPGRERMVYFIKAGYGILFYMSTNKTNEQLVMAPINKTQMEVDLFNFGGLCLTNI